MPDSASRQAGGASPRAVALIGPQGSGKSTLFDALLTTAGAAPARRPGDPRSRTAGTETRLGHCIFMDEPWALLDCPGSVEFGQETAAALAIADLAILVCEPSPARAAAHARQRMPLPVISAMPPSAFWSTIVQSAPSRPGVIVMSPSAPIPRCRSQSRAASSGASGPPPGSLKEVSSASRTRKSLAVA